MELEGANSALPQPDSVGYWAFEGYISYVKSGVDYDRPLREVVRVFWGPTTNAWHVARGEGRGRHPAKMLIGKWTRLHMPWEAK